MYDYLYMVILDGLYEGPDTLLCYAIMAFTINFGVTQHREHAHASKAASGTRRRIHSIINQQRKICKRDEIHPTPHSRKHSLCFVRLSLSLSPSPFSPTNRAAAARLQPAVRRQPWASLLLPAGRLPPPIQSPEPLQKTRALAAAPAIPAASKVAAACCCTR
jgi:hypothetical protein